MFCMMILSLYTMSMCSMFTAYERCTLYSVVACSCVLAKAVHNGISTSFTVPSSIKNLHLQALASMYMMESVLTLFHPPPILKKMGFLVLLLTFFVSFMLYNVFNDLECKCRCEDYISQQFATIQQK